MTTILGRYLFRQTTGAALLILLSLTGVIWIAVALRQMEVVTAQGQGAFVFFKMTALALPALLAFIAPIALLIASLQVLHRLNGDSELIVMTAGGQASWRLLWPLMTLAVVVAIGVSAVNHAVAPWANRLLRDYAVEIRTDLIGQVIQPGRFTVPEPNLTIHIRDRAPDGRLLGLLMHDARDEKQVTSYLAETGFIVKQDKAAYLLMQNGHILRRTSADGAAEVIAFDRYAVDINRFEQKVDQALALRPRERYSTELLWPDPDDPIHKAAPQRYISELHDRIAGGLYPFAFVLIAIAYTGQAQTTRQNRAASLVTGFTAALGLRILGIGAANAVALRPSLFWVLYAVPLGACVLNAGMIAANLRPRPPNRAQRAVAGATDRLRARLARIGRRRAPRPAGA